MSEKSIEVPNAVYEQLAKSVGAKKGRESVAEFRDRLEREAAKAWGVPVAVAREIIGTRWARRLFDNLKRHLKIERRNGEGLRAFRERAQREIGERWGYSGNSVRQFFMLLRRPSFDRSRQFYADLVEFGRAEFNGDGKVIASSLNKGPSVRQFLDVTPPGKDRVAAARAV